MTLRIAVVAGLLAGLVLWDRALSQAAVAERAERQRVGRLIPSVEREAMQIAALRLEFGSGERHLYARVGGMWRCLTAFNAPADAQALQALIGKLSEAEGRVQSDDPEQGPTYGIGTNETVRVSFCGPNVLADPMGDVLWACDVGRSFTGGDGSFVRVRGSREIWALDVDPHVEIDARHRPHLPPMLDGTIPSAAWASQRGGIERIFVDRRDGTGFELLRNPIEVTPGEMRPGVVPYEWILDPGESQQICHLQLATAFVFFSQTAPYEDLLSPAAADELGFDDPSYDPWVTVTLDPVQGDPLRLLVGDPLPGRGVPVQNPFTGLTYEVSREVADLLQPSAQQLLDPQLGNPWEPYLRR